MHRIGTLVVLVVLAVERATVHQHHEVTKPILKFVSFVLS